MFRRGLFCQQKICVVEEQVSDGDDDEDDNEDDDAMVSFPMERQKET